MMKAEDVSINELIDGEGIEMLADAVVIIEEIDSYVSAPSYKKGKISKKVHKLCENADKAMRDLLKLLTGCNKTFVHPLLTPETQPKHDDQDRVVEKSPKPNAVVVSGPSGEIISNQDGAVVKVIPPIDISKIKKEE